jgi:hypothetical protein
MPLAFLAGAPVSTHGQFALRPGGTPAAPPPAPPVQYRLLPPINTPQLPRPLGVTLYSIGQPTDEEQLYLEYINRMRANPTAEGQRLANTTDADVLSAYSFFNVDLGLMQSEFATNPPAPPLAFNANLIAAARWHSGDMFTNQYQGHVQTNGTTLLQPWDRMTAEGYTWSSAAENVFAYSKSVFYGHAGFAVDWGKNVGGMQTPPGHRNNMLDAAFREIGVGVVDGVNGSVGPQLVTQDFGTQPSGKPFICGVVYYDFNTNGLYDLGEGLGGVTVNTSGSANYALTANSGGYAIPITSNGNYTLTFTAAGLSTQTVVTVASLHNARVDFLPVYSPPVISGPNPAGVNQTNVYTFTAVGGASSYQWLQTLLLPYSYVEGAENGLTNVSVVSSPGYAVLAGDLVASGAHSFHLAQPVGADQRITLKPTIRPGGNSQLNFAKLLGQATTTQTARAQVSTDAGTTWQDVWTQSGNNSSGENRFSTVTVSLAAFANQNLQVRFVLETSGSYYANTSSGFGLYLDNIAFSNVSQPFSTTNNVPAGTSFSFVPASTGQYSLQVRPQIGTRFLNWGPNFAVNVTTASPALQVVDNPVLSGGQVQISFSVANYSPGMTFSLLRAASLSSGWVIDSSATVQTLVANSKFRFTTSTSGVSQGFFRVSASY